MLIVLFLFQAISHCLICNINLCYFCKEAHGRQRNTSQHDVRYLNDLKVSDCEVKSISIKQHNKCTVHPTHDLKLFCIGCYQVPHT